VTIQPYDIAATTNLYGHSPVDNEPTAPPEKVMEPELETDSTTRDGVYISSAARIYARFVRRVNSVLEEFVEQKTVN